MDLVSPRHDLFYLRRRPKPADTPAAPEAPVRRLTDILAPSAPEAPAPRAQPLTGTSTISLSRPVARLTQIQSGIGSLVVEGVSEVLWETTDRKSGSITASSSAGSPPVFANRPLVELRAGRAVVGLRHVREVRRVVFGSSGGPLTVSLTGGAVVTVDDGCVLYASVIDRVLDLRAEPADSTEPLATVFGFRPHW